MNKLFFTLLCLALVLNLNAQTLYGTTSEGGTGINTKGVISKFTLLTNTIAAAYTFDDPNPDGRTPLQTDLVQGTDGKLYGMTFGGGVNSLGTIFSYNPTTATYNKIRDLDSANGANPAGSFFKASNGLFYGTTAFGGNRNFGTIFSFNPATGAYIKLKDLDSINGSYPFCTLIQATDGKLYGTATNGGTGNFGVIFTFNPATGAYTKLNDFDSTNGYYPRGSLVQASNGKLYGMTTFGGTKDKGVLYSFNTSTQAYSKLYTFSGPNGANPYGSLMQAADGKLYGMTNLGGVGNFGVIFSFNTTTSAYTNLKTFDETNGANPFGTFTQTSDGILYGMTNSGGLYDEGVIFSFVPSSSTFTRLMEFDGKNGGNPRGELTLASDGKFYGLTRAGGGASYGVLFSFVPSMAAYTKLKVFGAVVNGSNIIGGVVQNAAGKLYGMFSSGGGLYGLGGIYSFDPSTSAYARLMDFNGNNGANPQGSLLLATDGKLYGMTTNGGTHDAGVLFSFNPATSTYTKLRDFDSSTGRNPLGSLMQASDGKLYGMTTFGGSSDLGVLFSFSPATGTYTPLLHFNSTNGANPRSSLVQASDGKLYGMTTYGGAIDAGVLFSFNPTSSAFSALVNFAGSSGAYPHGSLIQASDGKLYGNTYSGGSSGVGVLFSFTPATSTYARLKDFDLTNRPQPAGHTPASLRWQFVWHDKPRRKWRLRCYIFLCSSHLYLYKKE